MARMGNKIGRPTKYTKKLADEICSLLSSGKSIREVCEKPGMPSPATIFNWLLDEDKEEFLENYERAQEARADMMFEELISIADSKNKNVMRDRLRVDTRKWVLSRMKPKKYGDKLDVTSGGEKLPTPIMTNVSGDHSVQKNIEPKEEG